MAESAELDFYFFSLSYAMRSWGRGRKGGGEMGRRGQFAFVFCKCAARWYYCTGVGVMVGGEGMVVGTIQDKWLLWMVSDRDRWAQGKWTDGWIKGYLVQHSYDDMT